MGENEDEFLPQATTRETALDIASIIAGFAPYIGGAISPVLSGLSLHRKMDRIRDALNELSDEIKGFESEASKEYVKTEEFQDLLEKTLRQAADERSAEKRKIYAAFLAGAIKSPGEPYDEQVRFLRTLEQIQPDHIRILKAIMQQPDPNTTMYAGSRMNVLAKRVPEMNAARLGDLINQLNDLRVTSLELSGLMTGQGAEEMRGSITPYGQRLVDYIRQAE